MLQMMRRLTTWRMMITEALLMKISVRKKSKYFAVNCPYGNQSIYSLIYCLIQNFLITP